MESALRHVIRVICILMPWLAMFFISEFACRYFLTERLKSMVHLDERNLSYRHDPILGWFPIPSSQTQYTASRMISIQHNSKGFRDQEHGPKTLPRIAFLGDSFVWGFDAEEHERFTNKLQKLIPNWEVLNWGVSGYGTDQEYLLLQRVFDEYKPDIVFLLFSGNDPEDNTSSVRYLGYFKPYFALTNGGLVARGIPVPVSYNFHFANHQLLYKSYLFRELTALVGRVFLPDPIEVVPDPTKPLILAIRDWVTKKGAVFAIGFADENKEIFQFAVDSGIPAVELNNPMRYPLWGGHWTPEGHELVAQKIRAFLNERKLLLTP